jgi:hypothetical protein
MQRHRYEQKGTRLDGWENLKVVFEELILQLNCKRF